MDGGEWKWHKQYMVCYVIYVVLRRSIHFMQITSDLFAQKNRWKDEIRFDWCRARLSSQAHYAFRNGHFFGPTLLWCWLDENCTLPFRRHNVQWIITSERKKIDISTLFYWPTQFTMGCDFLCCTLTPRSSGTVLMDSWICLEADTLKRIYFLKTLVRTIEQRFWWYLKSFCTAMPKWQRCRWTETSPARALCQFNYVPKTHDFWVILMACRI